MAIIIQIIIALLIAGFVFWAVRQIVALIPLEPIFGTGPFRHLLHKRDQPPPPKGTSPMVNGSLTMEARPSGFFDSGDRAHGR